MLEKASTEAGEGGEAVHRCPPLLTKFETTRALVRDAELARTVDELADGLALTSAAIGAEGAPSRSWVLFREIVQRATLDDVAALVAHRDPVVRAYLAGFAAAQATLASRAYGLLADATPVRTIAGTLSSTESVGGLVMKALGRAARHCEPARDALLLAIGDERLPLARRLEALEHATALGCGEARPAALGFVLGEEVEARAAGLRALATLGTEDDLPLVLAAASDPRAKIRFAAAEALRLGPGHDAQATAALERLLVDEDAGVRAAAVATYAFRPEGREARLGRLLAGDEGATAPGIAAVSLLAAGGERAWALLEPLLMQPVSTATIPARFWSALSQVDDRARLPFMRRLLDSRAEVVRTTAMRFVGEAQDWESEPLLRRSLDGIRPGDRATAATALARLGARDAVPEIAGRLRDVSDDVRAAAARALADLGAREAMSQLLSALAHEKLSTVREAIMEALHALETRGRGRRETWEG